MKPFAAFVKELWKEVHRTRQEVAERVGVALTVIRKIELYSIACYKRKNRLVELLWISVAGMLVVYSAFAKAISSLTDEMV